MKASTFFTLAIILAICHQFGFATPILSGDGAEPTSATGSFGSSGRIFEYRMQGSTGLSFLSAQTSGVDQLRLSYSFTATSALVDAAAMLYLDADINQDVNTWFNERGEALVQGGGADSWEIDEPGFGSDYIGDIYDHYLIGSYDNTVFGGQTDKVEDVAMGLGLHFGNLGVGDQLQMEVLLSESSIGSGWGTVLHQWDNDDCLAGDNLYFASRFNITRVPPPDPGPGPIGTVPEPGSTACFLLGIGMLAVMGAKRKNFRT